MPDGARDLILEDRSSGGRLVAADGRALPLQGVATPPGAARPSTWRVQRRLEAALDAEGLSTTARAVLARIRGPQ